MARRTAQQPITYSATFAPAPMTADGVLRMQRYCARSMAQTILACPELLEMGETAAGLLVPTTSGMADFALFDDLFTKSTLLNVRAQDSPQIGQLLPCDATTRQESTFRAVWMQWVAKQVLTNTGCRVFSFPLRETGSAPTPNTMLYRAMHPLERPYYRSPGTVFRQYATHEQDIVATMRRTA